MDTSWRRNLYILFSIQVLSTAGFSLVFPFLPLYVKEIGIATRGSVEFWSGLVFSSQAVTMMFASPIWGSVADRYGRKMMLVRATFGGAILIGLMGFAQNAEQLVVLRTIQGLVTGVLAAGNALVAANTPKEHTGAALGLMQMGRWAGVAVGPVIGGVIGDAFGFRESFWITGIMLGLAGLCVIIWVREDFHQPDTRTRPSFWQGYKLLLTTPGMAGLYSLTFLRSLGQTIISPFIALFIVSLTGAEQGAASITGFILGCTAFAGALSSVYFGRLGDRLGHSRVMIAAALAALLFYLPQPFVTAAWQLLILQMLTGIATGGIMPTLAALMNLWTPGNSQGSVYGLENSVTASARIFSPMLGASLTLWFGLRGVFAGAAIVYGLLALMAVLVANSAKMRSAMQLQAADD
ncbi:MAG: MFS transporter [Caldilineaceae bacterium]